MSTETPLKPGKADKPDAARAANSVRVTADAFRKLTTHAKKLDINNGKYASAAIAFFAEAGLDPTKERPAGLAEVTATVIKEARTTRVQQVDIGNRTISILRAWEKALYGFLQQQQGGTLNYLEQIENAILRHLVTVETNLLSPMVEMMVKNNIETYMGRVIAERTGLHMTGKKESEWDAANRAMNDDRDQQLIIQMREFIKTNGVPVPQLAPKPLVPVLPPKAPMAPASGTPAGGTALK